MAINYFLASGDFCRLLISFGNSLDPDWDQQNVIMLALIDTLRVFRREFLQSKILKMSSDDNKSMKT